MVAALGHGPVDVAADLLDYRAHGIRDSADGIDRDIDVWFRERWWDRSNLVATDFFLSNNLVDVAKQVNLKRAICTRAGEGFHLEEAEEEEASKRSTMIVVQ